MTLSCAVTFDLPPGPSSKGVGAGEMKRRVQGMGFAVLSQEIRTLLRHHFACGYHLRSAPRQDRDFQEY